MASSLMQWLTNPRRNWFAAQHYKALCNRLKKYGLRYDDLYDPMSDLDIKEALARLPREVVDARNQRLKRAMDLSMKHEYLPEDLQALQTPFRGYLKEMLALVKKENAEREALGALLSISGVFHKMPNKVIPFPGQENYNEISLTSDIAGC